MSSPDEPQSELLRMERQQRQILSGMAVMRDDLAVLAALVQRLDSKMSALIEELRDTQTARRPTSVCHPQIAKATTPTPASTIREAKRRAYWQFAQTWVKGLMDRAEHDMTASAFATGVKYTTLRRILNGETKSMHFGTLNQIAIGYGVPLPPELTSGPAQFSVSDYPPRPMLGSLRPLNGT